MALPDLLGGPVQELVAPVLDTVGPLPGAPQQPAPGAPAAPPPAAAELPRTDAAAPVPAAAPVFGPSLPTFSPFALGFYHSSFLYNYADLLSGRIGGGFGKLHSGAISPELLASSTGAPALGMADPATQDVVAAGSASTLPTAGSDRVALPVLVAVLMLAIVSAAVIRSWMVITRR